ncbi:MAG: hypothetical protein AVO39_07935 [delta proteobacterium MLS_D]|jgi:flagellar M-ring protein FliF|nr:MAG: hypothetical protein AVO39_07935 [delta proteobacterium MLS_D]
MDGLVRFITEFAKGFGRLTPSRQIAFVSVMILSVATIFIIFHFMNRTDYVVLYSDLSPEETGAVTLKLKEKNVPYQVSLSGGRVMVPSDQLSELRIEMASSGLPLRGGTGFEIFDEKNFGVTEFVQKLNYQRALQGELARTISGLDEIAGSRVHIVLPEKSVFSETSRNPTASVALRMKQGQRLQPSQVDGIVKLVAGSVEGLNPEDVMVVDNSGVILSSAGPQSEFALMTGSQLEYRKSIEHDLTERVQSMIERVVGEGKAIVTVSAVLDFEEFQKTEEYFDPDEPVVRSVQRKTERSANPLSAKESTVEPTGEKENSKTVVNREQNDEVIHYEVSKTVSTSVKPLGEIENLSVAVVVDGSYRVGESGEEVYEPRSAQELAQLDDLVKKAVGFDERRGDQVTVSNIPFKQADLGEEDFVVENSWKETLQAVMPVLKAVLMLAALLAVIFLVLRPMSRVIVAAGRGGRGALPALTGTERASISDVERHRERAASALDMSEMNIDESNEISMVKNMARQDTGTFTELLRGWLK